MNVKNKNKFKNTLLYFIEEKKYLKNQILSTDCRSYTAKFTPVNISTPSDLNVEEIFM